MLGDEPERDGQLGSNVKCMLKIGISLSISGLSSETYEERQDRPAQKVEGTIHLVQRCPPAQQ